MKLTKKVILDNWNTILSLMDDDKREDVHEKYSPCDHEYFLIRYLDLDPDFENLIISTIVNG